MLNLIKWQINNFKMHPKALEKEHIMVEGTLIQMVTDSQKHNKKMKTELD